MTTPPSTPSYSPDRAHPLEANRPRESISQSQEPCRGHPSRPSPNLPSRRGPWRPRFPHLHQDCKTLETPLHRPCNPRIKARKQLPKAQTKNEQNPNPAPMAEVQIESPIRPHPKFALARRLRHLFPNLRHFLPNLAPFYTFTDFTRSEHQNAPTLILCAPAVLPASQDNEGRLLSLGVRKP